MSSLRSPERPDLESRVLAGRARNEDAVVLSVPAGYAIVQTVDILAPVVNDAYHFGRIAAANALSDVYAMGGEPWCAMNIACFPDAFIDENGGELARAVLQGGLDTVTEANAVLAGGHTVQDDEVKFGLAVTGIIDPSCMAVNSGLTPGLRLLLTKPLGTGILSTAVKAGWEGSVESEAEVTRWCGRLNAVGGSVIRRLRLPAATDVTGFGLGGHALEMAMASKVCVALDASALPLMPRVLEYARDGLIPAGSHRNRTHWQCKTFVESGLDEALESLIFDAQTSGGLLLAVPQNQLDEARELLLAGGDLACEIGEILPARADGKALLLRA